MTIMIGIPSLASVMAFWLSLCYTHMAFAIIIAYH